MATSSLTLQLLAWVADRPRTYGETMEAWRTTCPRLTIWEDANDRGFIARRRTPRGGALISVSAAGAEHLRKHGRRRRLDGSR